MFVLPLSSVIQLPGLLIVGPVPVDMLETGLGALWGNTFQYFNTFLVGCGGVRFILFSYFRIIDWVDFAFIYH